MRLSDEKITHLSHIILKQLLGRDIIDILEEEGEIRKEIKRSIIKLLRSYEEVDENIRKKLQSYSKKIVEGSPEWDVLYQKFLHEEEAKRGFE